MKVSNYSYYCSNSILQKISNMSKDNKMRGIYDNYNKIFNDNDDIDIKWMLVSTALLMSEGLFKNDKAYDYISLQTISEIEEKLFSFGRWMPGEKVNTPYLLDSNNKAALPFSDFLPFGNLENDNYDYLDDVDVFTPEYIKYLKEEDYFLNRYNDPKLIDGKFGCNVSIISDGLIDIKKLIIRVRNALAHSNYEVIDKNNIRLYHYNRNIKKLDFNVILDTSTIINILDELNEIAYKKYKEFNNLYFSHSYIDYTLAIKKDSCDDDYINYILSFGLCDRDTASMILDTAINSDMYKTLSYDKEYLDDSYDVNMDNVNKMAVIVEVMFDYVKPYCDFGILINNIMYTDKNGYINSDELFDKYNRYEYLKSDFYKSNYSIVDDEIYKDNYFNLLVLSFLNCSLLTTHNEYENRNIDYLTFDFSSMVIDKAIMNKFLLKHISSNENIILNLNKNINDIDDLIEKKNDDIVRKTELLLTEYRDIKYFNEDLPNIIISINLSIKELEDRKRNILNTISVISSDIIKYNYNQDLSNFIFNSLRNSLAHGYVKVLKNNDNISETEIIFEDYMPNDRTQLTFRGKIKLGDLLDILTNEEVVGKLYSIDEDNIINRKRR